MVVYTVNKKLIAFYNFLWYNCPPVTIETRVIKGENIHTAQQLPGDPSVADVAGLVMVETHPVYSSYHGNGLQ